MRPVTISPDDDEPETDPSVVRLAEFEGAPWKTALLGSRKVDASDLADIYLKAAKTAEADNDAVALRVFRLLFQVCNITLDPDDRATAFRPRLILRDGRSAEPADYRGAQSAVFAALVAEVPNPGLKARLGDIVWTNDRRAHEAAALAVEGYCEAVEGLLSGAYDEAIPGFGRATFEQVALVHRALQIGRATWKGDNLPPPAEAAARAVYDLALSAREHVVFCKIAHVLGVYGLAQPDQLARDAESVADGPFPAGHDMAAQGVWDFAASAYAAAKDVDGERRCRLRSVDMTLIRARSAPSAIVSSHFLKVAIEALRHTRDSHEQRAALLLELRDRQLAARDEMRPMGHRVDVSDLVQASLQGLDDLGLAHLLRAFVLLHRPSDPQAQRAEAVDSLARSPFSGLFAGAYHDADGKVVAETPASGFGETPDEASVDEAIHRSMAIERNLIVGGTIHPVREHILARFAVAERHVWPLVELSPFVPEQQEALFALGFARFLQGDMMSAAHLLVPQIEPALRHVLICAGHEPTVIKSNGLQEDQSLEPLLTRWRPQLEAILGPEIVFEIDIVFNQRPGPRLRHDFAHGKLTAGRCYSPDVVYACWLMLHVVALPLLDHWDSEIAPMMQRIEDAPSALRR
jgi:hypothetical protein